MQEHELDKGWYAGEEKIGFRSKPGSGLTGALHPDRKKAHAAESMCRFYRSLRPDQVLNCSAIGMLFRGLNKPFRSSGLPPGFKLGDRRSHAGKELN